MKLITQSELKERMHYDPDTGLFVDKLRETWRDDRYGICGFLRKGYRIITINKSKYHAHRLAFLYMTGRFPDSQVDHINGIMDDNRWCNLRPVDIRENSLNQRIPKNNKSGHIGVFFSKINKKWCARIKVKSRMIHLGAYQSIEEAIMARKKANELYGFHENHGRNEHETIY